MTNKSQIRIRNLYNEPDEYILELYAARYLWNLGYRCIGYNVEMRPYGKFSVVGVKVKDTPCIAVIDCINSCVDFDNKSMNVVDLEAKEHDVMNEVLASARKYHAQNKEINIVDDPVWESFSDSLYRIKTDLKNKTLYWNMIFSYRIANYHWVFGHERDLVDAKCPEGWGLVKLKKNLVEGNYKTYKIEDAPPVGIHLPFEDHLLNCERRIARSLTKEMIGSDLQKPENIHVLLHYLNIKKSHQLASLKLSKSILKEEKAFNKAVAKVNKLS